ncbi:MAG TPA: hypothetical protein VFG03_13265 [Telluria sp.]|nr:hypothetical protein [Telluria sp.]
MNHAFRRHWLACSLAACALGVLLWGALAPLRFATRDQLFEIPKGTWARRMAGDKVEILPARIRLTLGVQDVLLLRNSDTVPQIFGPVLIMPGQDFRLPFEQASDYQFACSAHASGQMTVAVVALPDPGWNRLRWRVDALVDAIRVFDKGMNRLWKN